MFGMDFSSFLVLLFISVVVSAVLHFGFKFYVTDGMWSFLSKVVVGWFGAWLGSPIIGHWWEAMRMGDVYYIPAVIGSLAMLIVAVDLGKMMSRR